MHHEPRAFWPTNTHIALGATLLLSLSLVMATASYAGFGNITTVAGGNGQGTTGIGGPATSAKLQLPETVALDAAGNLYIADTGAAAIRKVDKATGIITTIAGNGWNFTGQPVGDGARAGSAKFSMIQGIALDGAGNLYVSDSWIPAIRRIEAIGGVVTPESIITTIVGGNGAGYSGDGGLATNAKMEEPYGLAFDTSGNLFIADYMNNAIRKVAAVNGNITAGSIITTVAGTGTRGYSGDGGPATSALLAKPTCIALDSAGNFAFTEYGNGTVRRVDAATGIITTVMQGAGQPAGIAFDGTDNLYVAATKLNAIRRVDAVTGFVTVVSGNNGGGYSGDGGLAVDAQLNEPKGMAFDDGYNLSFVDSQNYAIRTIEWVLVIITSPLLEGAREGTAFSATLATDSPGPSFAWTVSSGQLPSGLSLNASTGVISGTPAAGSGNKVYVFDVTAVDQSTPNPAPRNTATKTFTLWVGGAALPLPYSTGFESGEYVPARLTAGSRARAQLTADAANTGTLGLQLDAVPGFQNWELQDTGGAGKPGADDPAAWETDAPENTGALEWAMLTPGVTGLTVTFDYKIVNGNAGINGPWYVNFALEWSDDQGASWNLAAGNGAETIGPAGEAFYRTATGGFVSTLIGVSGIGGGQTEVLAHLRWLVKWGLEDRDISPIFETWVAIDNLSVTAGAPTTGVLTIATSSLSAATEGQNYSTALQASEGNPPYTWSVVGGTLPGGLSLDPTTGVLAGTPFPGTGANSYPITVRVTDSTGSFVDKNLTLVVNPASTALAITTTALASGREGDAYSFTLGASGGTPPYAWAVDALTPLPSGLSLDAATGIISGTPTVGASATSPYDITITVSDASGGQALTQLQLTIVAQGGVLITITTAALPNAWVGVPYVTALSAVDGTAPYTWRIAGGALPTGVLLNQTSGAITGTPVVGTGGNWAFTAQVTDALGMTAVKPLTLTVIYLTPDPLDPRRNGSGGCAMNSGDGASLFWIVLALALVWQVGRGCQLFTRKPYE